MSSDVVASLLASDVPSAAQVMARAFGEDPLYAAVVPDRERRARLLTWLFGRVVRYAQLYGRVDIGGRGVGVACWLPPGPTGLRLGGLIRSKLFAVPLKLGLGAYRRFNVYEQAAARLRTNAPGPHWYLWALGVEPTVQGQGIGGRLITQVLREADAAGLACYLETGTEAAARFYSRHGFGVMERARLPSLAIDVVAMVRPAPATLP
jgi:ribosomal protein S18 acetylase RimI-like enzyme